jgi:hypothetical protein
MRLLAAVLAAVLSLAVVSSAWARPLTEEEAKTLDKALTRYLQAISGRDAEAMIRAIPPRVLNVVAGTAGIESGALVRTLTEQTADLIKDARFRDVTADQSALDANDAQLSDGSPVTWVVVPTSFVVRQNGASTRNDIAVLALFEAGAWYFLRIDGPQQKQIAALAYPFLAEAPIPEPVQTPVN